MHAERKENIRLPVDEWLNVPDRAVSEGNIREGGGRDWREGMIEKERGVDVIESKMVETRGSESDKGRQRGREKESQ